MIEHTGHGIGFGEAFRVWLKIALLSFGGPAGQIAVMHRILVEEKNWISAGARTGRPEFAAIGHGGGKTAAAIDGMLGQELPDHVRPSVPRALKVSVVWLLLWLTPVLMLLVAFGQTNVFSQIAVFFSKMAMVTFGGAYAVLAGKPYRCDRSGCHSTGRSGRASTLPRLY